MKVYAVLRDKNSLLTYTYGFAGTPAFLSRVICEKCELCLALDESEPLPDGDYVRLKQGDLSVLPTFSFSSSDTTVSILFYSGSKEEYDEFVGQIRLDDLIGEDEH